MKRLFAAIHIIPDAHFLSIFAGLQRQLKTEKIRWVKPENLHITLKFFGETPVEKIDIITGVIKKIALNHHPIKIQLKKTGIFGSRYKPRVIWFGVGENKQFLLLAREILTELDKVGFPIDRQNFVPHLTLGRMRTVRNKIAFQEAIQSVSNVFVQESKINSIKLFESKLRVTGVFYDIIEEYKLEA